MAISYPLTLPNYHIARIVLSATTAVSISRSPFSFASQTQRFNGQMWFAEVTLPAMNREQAELWTTFLLKLNGRQGTFLLGDPSKALPQGGAIGTPLVKGSGQTGNAVITNGWFSSYTNILKAGDMIQLGQRLHTVLNDVNSDSNGEATLDIWPRLREVSVDGTAVLTAEPKGLFRLATNLNDVYSVNADLNYVVNFSAEEAL